MKNSSHIAGELFGELFGLTGGFVNVNRKTSPTLQGEFFINTIWVVSYLELDKWAQVTSPHLTDALRNAISNIKRHDPLEGVEVL